MRKSLIRFVHHFVEMLVAMVAGMMLLDPLWRGLWPTLVERPDSGALLMAFDMAVGMGLWMWIRGHGGRMIIEMGVAMVAPFVLALVPYYLDLLSGEGVMLVGHVGMVLAMLAQMVIRVHHYTHPMGWRFRLRRRSEVEEVEATVDPAAVPRVPSAG